MKYAFLALALLGCTDKGDDTDEPGTEAPTLAFVAPAEGEAVFAGDVQVAVAVEHFVFQAPTATARFDPTLLLPVSSAWAHGEEGGEAAGFVRLTLDGADVADLTETVHRLTGVAAGSHTLDAALHYADGDEVGVTASVTFTAQ